MRKIFLMLLCLSLLATGSTALAETWEGLNTKIKVEIDDSFKPVYHSISDSNQWVGRQYQVYQKGRELIIIGEVTLKKGKTWAEDWDPLLGKDQSTKATVGYSKGKYALYKGLSSPAKKACKVAKVDLPKCYHTSLIAKVDDNRKSGVWIYMVEPAVGCSDIHDENFAFGSYVSMTKYVKFISNTPEKVPSCEEMANAKFDKCMKERADEDVCAAAYEGAISYCQRIGAKAYSESLNSK